MSMDSGANGYRFRDKKTWRKKLNDVSFLEYVTTKGNGAVHLYSCSDESLQGKQIWKEAGLPNQPPPFDKKEDTLRFKAFTAFITRAKPDMEKRLERLRAAEAANSNANSTSMVIP